jgi:transposase
MASGSEKTTRVKRGGARPGAGRKPKVRSAVDPDTSRDRSGGQRQRANPKSLPEICPDSAGIDIGAELIVAAVPEDRDEQSVRSFGAFTEDLYALADWLQACRIRNVAMEATGIYWVPLFQILENRGFQVTLVNARNVKNVPGRKSDVKDSRWIQFLHAVGLLQGSFRPSDEICALRSYMRHRDKLVAVSASHVLRMQKSLTQMNVQLHNVISDITGVSGLAILDSILEGQRDPEFLAGLCDRRIKADQETVRKSLVGDWRPEHLFTLGQELRAYRFCQELIAECDAAMEVLLAQSAANKVALDFSEEAASDSQVPKSSPCPRAKTRKNASLKTAREIRLTNALRKIFGTDMTLVPGLGVDSLYRLFTELGNDLKAFPSGPHFCSHLGLCPDNRISGGKVLSAKTRHVPSRAATTFRLCANSLERSDTPLGEYLRRMKARLGKQEGITATAHKLARIFYRLVTTGETYDEERLQPTEAQKQRRIRRLAAEAAKHGFTLTPNPVPQ